MSDQDGGDQASRDDPLWDAFEARFPAEAFKPIARALGKGTERVSLEALRGWLLPDFCSFYASCTTDQRFRTQRVRELKNRGKAAVALLSSLKSGWFLDQPRNLRDAPFRKEFMETLEELADAAGTRNRERYRPKDAFRNELTPGLAWVYEHVTGERAKKPYWLGDTGTYGGAFYQFTLAVWECLYARVPEVRACLSASDQALAQELQNHWPEQGPDRVKKACEIVS
jgi:hypothetical protein